jgi:hypothetical protein
MHRQVAPARLNVAQLAKCCVDVAILSLVLATPMHEAAAQVIPVSDSASFQAALDTATSGQQIVLAPGVYPGRFTATGLADVAIRSADANDPAVIDAAGLGEGIKFSSIKSVAISDLIIRNASVNGINIDDGGFIELSENVTIRNVDLRDGGGDGIKLTGVFGFHIDQVKVVGWGGDWTAVNFIGSHDGVVERSYFENLAAGSGAGVQAKAGSADIVIRANRFVNANERSIQIGGSGQVEFFRPQPAGNVHAARIVAEGNVILNNGNVGQGIRAAASFVNVGDGILRNNVVHRPSIYALRILKENLEPPFIDTQNGVIDDNIFLWNHGDLSDAVNVGWSTLPATFEFEANQWFNLTSPANSQLPLPVAEVDGVYGVNPQVDLRGITPWDFSWGKWLVNTSDLIDSVPIDSSQDFLLATPGEDATLDIGAVNPLIGEWSLEPVAAGAFTVDPFSYAVLLRADFQALPGNYNNDTVVDSLDLDVWRGSFGQAAGSPADGDGNGRVDGADFLIWQKGLGGSLPGPGVTVAEPKTSAMLVAFAVSLMWAARYAHVRCLLGR